MANFEESLPAKEDGKMKINGTMMQYFHWYYGNSVTESDLWEMVKQEVENLSALGVTALWLPLPYKGTGGAHDVGYGIYDLYDLG